MVTELVLFIELRKALGEPHAEAFEHAGEDENVGRVDVGAKAGRREGLGTD